MTTLMAESIARSAIEIAAKVPAETEADSVAVAVKEAGTNRTKKQSPIWGLFLFVLIVLRYILVIWHGILKG